MLSQRAPSRLIRITGFAVAAVFIISYFYALWFTAHFFAEYGLQHSPMDWLIYLMLAIGAVAAGGRASRARFVFITVVLAILFIDPNPIWNTSSWWRTHLSPFLNFFMCLYIPVFFYFHRRDVRAFVSRSVLALFPLWFLALWFLRIHIGPEFNLVGYLLYSHEPRQLTAWLWRFPHSFGFLQWLNACYAVTWFYTAALLFSKEELAGVRKRGGVLALAIAVACLIFIVGFALGKNVMFTDGQYFRLWGFRVGALFLSFKCLLLIFLLGVFYSIERSSLNRKLLLISEALLVVVLTLTLSRSSLIALMVGLVFVAARLRTKAAVLAPVGALAIVAATLSTVSFFEGTNQFGRYTRHMTVYQNMVYDPKFSRPMLYDWGFKRFAASPLVGVGYDWQRQYLGEAPATLATLAKLDSLRNYYLDLAVSGGLLELLPFLGFVVLLMIVFLRKPRTQGSVSAAFIVACAIQWLFYSPLLEPNCSVLFYFVMGLFVTIADAGAPSETIGPQGT